MNSNLYILVNKLKEGDETAFRDIFDLHHKKIFGYCIKYGQSKEDAEEVVQEVFIKLWTNRKSLDPEQNIQSYIFSIAKNSIIDKFKQLTRRKAASEHQIRLLQPRNDTEETVLYNELQKNLEKTFNSLPEIRKLVFQMSRYKGYKNHEIAEELGISVRTVENHIHKALQAFKDEMGQSSALILAMVLLGA